MESHKKEENVISVKCFPTIIAIILRVSDPDLGCEPPSDFCRIYWIRRHIYEWIGTLAECKEFHRNNVGWLNFVVIVTVQKLLASFLSLLLIRKKCSIYIARRKLSTQVSMGGLIMTVRISLAQYRLHRMIVLTDVCTVLNYQSKTLDDTAGYGVNLKVSIRLIFLEAIFILSCVISNPNNKEWRVTEFI